MGIQVPIGLAVAAVSCLLALKWPIGQAKRDQLARSFARKVDLGLRPDLAQAVGDRLVRRRRFHLAAVGLAVGLLIALFTWLNSSSSPRGALLLMGYYVVIWFGRALGTMAVQTVDDRRGSRPRAAHLTSPTVLDFVTPLELWSTRAAVTVGLALAGFGAVTAPSARQRTGILVVLACCAAIWLAVELISVVVARSRPAASDVQSLAFDDALRAEALRAFMFAGYFPLYWLASAAIELDLPSPLPYALMGVCLAALVPALRAESSARARQQFRRRLWGTPVTDPSTLSR